MTRLDDARRDLAARLMPVAEAVARSFGTRHPMAEEILSAAMLGVIRAAAAVDIESHPNPRAFAWVAARRMVLNALVRRRGWRPTFPLGHDAELMADHPGFAWVGDRDEAVVAMSALKPRVAEILRLVHVEGLKQSEAAGRLGIRQAAVSRLLSRHLPIGD